MRDLTIGKNEAGQRMDKYLKKYFPEAGSGSKEEYSVKRKKSRWEGNVEAGRQHPAVSGGGDD